MEEYRRDPLPGEGKGDTRRGLLLKYGLNDRVVFEEQEPLVSLLYRGPN